MDNYFTELAAYHLWATEITCGWLSNISNEQWNQPVISSFGSIRQTTLHMLSSEDAWVQRLHGKENVEQLEKTFQGTKEEHIALWKQLSGQFKAFVTAFDESRLSDQLHFKRFNGEASSAKYYQLFAQVVNHATYHRGQLVTLLRQVGYTDVNATDLIVYYRN
ncbi:damage-inducible protein DinB [Niabella ginsenosidivorans]|uniref:Damage-inducible protein DinB n=1 Tax=Niabella ginsenosidivorans TaxID=1176587 RepID=A0A1A9HWY7_9BACT|nr:DinB family protein [Niabella ginsenosidivorans]ANH79918.1 damage-inducible protein DinB [Niabella ginsenosidivorans]